MIRNLGVVLAVVLVAQPAFADDAFDTVVACMSRNVPTSLRTQAFEITSVDRASGTRTLSGKVFAERENGLLRVMLLVAKPVDLKGSAYLLREGGGNKEDDVYLSLPKVGTVRHIRGTQASQSLLATDFSYADLRQIQNAFTEGGGLVEGGTMLDNRPVTVISIEPKLARGSPYSLIRAWVDQKTCVAWQADFYESSVPRKRLVGRHLTESNGFSYLSEMQMHDLKNGTYTTLKLKVVASEKDMADRYFKPNTFATVQ